MNILTTFRLFILFFIICFSIFCEEETKATEPKVIPKNLVSVIIPDTSETETLELKNHQTAHVKVYLSSLGDQMDAYMISLIETSQNTQIVSLISDVAGEVVFKKVPAGTYAVYLNRKVANAEQENSTVKISDVVLKAYP